jgi:hypothetical protein
MVILHQKPETALVQKQQGYFTYTELWFRKRISISREIFQLKIELGLSMDMDFSSN